MILIQALRRCAVFAMPLALLLSSTAAIRAAQLNQAPLVQPTGTHQLFLRGAVEAADFSQVTLPIARGTSNGQTVYYVVTDSDNRSEALSEGINYAPKLAFARGTGAAQAVNFVNGVIDFPATVDFSGTRQLAPGPTGFPPATAVPGATGHTGYTPLIELPDGTVENAPQIANDSGRAAKVLALDTTRMTVTYKETTGFYENQTIHYVSFDASNPVPAAIENVTFSAAFGNVQRSDGEDPPSAREGLVAFVNGQTGANNPQRQGLASALLDGLDPLNIVHEEPPDASDISNPIFPRYSPVWDVHLAAWTPAAIASGQNIQQRDFDFVVAQAQLGLITAPDGGPFASAGFVVNCPLVSIDKLN